jgi:hypothetical protein
VPVPPATTNATFLIYSFEKIDLIESKDKDSSKASAACILPCPESVIDIFEGPAFMTSVQRGFVKCAGKITDTYRFVKEASGWPFPEISPHK